MTVIPLHQPTQDEHTPEELFISALIESGDYSPTKYGVPPHAIRGWADVHRLCMDHQERAGYAPPVELVLSRFPDFPFVPGVGPAWAAIGVADQETTRDLRKTLVSASMSVRDGNNAEAIKTMREGLASITVGSSPGTNVTDFSPLYEAQEDQAAPIPPGHLSEVTGGHWAGELWMVAAVWGVGKSWTLCDHAVAAAEGGWDVHFHTLEMSTAKMLNRIHQIALREWAVGTFDTLEARKEAIDTWAAECGELTVFGPEHGRRSAAMISGQVTHRKTLVIVDYLGRMYTNDGVPAKKDWTSQSMVSQELAEVVSARRIPGLVAVQVNRQGDVAGSMDLERDADLIMELGRISSVETVPVRKNTLKKIRDGAPTKPWHTRFDPTAGRFGDITGEEAMALKADEEAIYL